MALAMDAKVIRSLMDISDLWDIFYSPYDTAGVWFGLQLALALGERGQRARLYCHDVPALSVAHAHLDPHVLIQTLGRIEILDHRLARNISAGHNLVEIGNAVLPSAYMSRFFSLQAGGNRFSLRMPGSDAPGAAPIQLRAQSPSHRHFDVRLGHGPQAAGLIRSVSQAPVLRPGPQATLAARASLLHLLGLPTDLLESDRTLYLGAAEAPVWTAWLQGLVDGDASTCVFVEHGPLQEQIAPVFSRIPGQPGTSAMGALRLVCLPPLLWSMVDELVTVSDLVLTDRDDLALRAAERGTPALRSSSRAAATAATTDFADLADWLFGSDSSPLATCYRQAAAAFGTGADVMAHYRALMTQLEDLQTHVRGLAARFGQAPDLVALLLTTAGLSSGQPVERLFAPTQQDASP